MGLDERENPGGTIASFVDEVELAGNRDGARATGFCSLLRSTAAEIRRRRSERRHRQRRSLPRRDWGSMELEPGPAFDKKSNRIDA